MCLDLSGRMCVECMSTRVMSRFDSPYPAGCGRPTLLASTCTSRSTLAGYFQHTFQVFSSRTVRINSNVAQTTNYMKLLEQPMISTCKRRPKLKDQCTMGAKAALWTIQSTPCHQCTLTISDMPQRSEPSKCNSSPVEWSDCFTRANCLVQKSGRGNGRGLPEHLVCTLCP